MRAKRHAKTITFNLMLIIKPIKQIYALIRNTYYAPSPFRYNISAALITLYSQQGSLCVLKRLCSSFCIATHFVVVAF